MNYIVQYFVFDKSGNHIIKACGVPCETMDEVHDTKQQLVSLWEEEKDTTQLLVSCGNDILFSSNND